MRSKILSAGLVALSLSSCAMTPALAGNVVASYYYQGKRTANGEHFNPNGMTCAHKRLPFGTQVRVTYNGRSAVCRINDRGPFIRGREIDLSRGVAQAIGMIGVGVGRIHMEVL